MILKYKKYKNSVLRAQLKFFKWDISFGSTELTSIYDTILAPSGPLYNPP